MVKPEGHANRMYERLRAAYPRVDAEYHAQPAPIRTLEDLPEADLIALLHGIPDVEFWHANLVATQGEQASVLFDAKLASCRANMDAEAKASLGGGAPETQDERLVALTKTDAYLNRAQRDAEIFKRPPAPPPELAPLNVNDVLELISHFMSDPLDAELEKAIVENPELFSGTESVHAAPYVPDFTLIPDALARFAESEESAPEFRARLKRLWQRFGIADGKNFPGGGEALTGDEKITMREIDIVLNSEEGQKAGLLEWMKADKPQD